MHLVSWRKVMRTINHTLLLLFLVNAIAFAQEKTFELPATWMEDSIQITIHGLFRVDEKTKEGWIGKDEEQYKIFITYANTSKERYEPNISLFEDSPGVGYLRIETLSGAIYDPKYTGGASVPSPLKPLYEYTTHNYAFNLKKGEIPAKLLRYHNRDRKQLTEVFVVWKLINPPIPETTRQGTIGSKIIGSLFSYKILKHIEADFVVKGRYSRDKFHIFKPKPRYKFVVLFVEITNIGNTVERAPLYAGDGEFNVITNNGDSYADISPFLTPKFNHWVQSTNDPSSLGYPVLKGSAFRVYPRESEVLVKAFEIPIWSNPAEFKFRLLDDIREVIIRVE